MVKITKRGKIKTENSHSWLKRKKIYCSQEVESRDWKSKDKEKNKSGKVRREKGEKKWVWGGGENN